MLLTSYLRVRNNWQDSLERLDELLAAQKVKSSIDSPG
jgi:hypothetical protein